MHEVVVYGTIPLTSSPSPVRYPCRCLPRQAWSWQAVPLACNRWWSGHNCRREEVGQETFAFESPLSDSFSVSAPAWDPTSCYVDCWACAWVLRLRRAAAEENPPGNNLNANKYILLACSSGWMLLYTLVFIGFNESRPLGQNATKAIYLVIYFSKIIHELVSKFRLVNTAERSTKRYMTWPCLVSIERQRFVNSA